MKNQWITPLLLIGTLFGFNTKVIAQAAQAAQGANSFTAGAATITFGTTVKSGGSGGSSQRSVDGKRKLSKRDCVPGAGVCQMGRLTAVTANKNRVPANPYLFYVDSLHRPNLALLIHTDSISDSYVEVYNYFHKMKNAYDTLLGNLNNARQYPGILSSFSLSSDYAFTLDSASCKTIGINTDANGLYVPPNTLCLISQPTADTNYYLIRFLGTIGNRISLSMGDTRNNCDSTKYSICGIYSFGSNTNYAFFDTMHVTSALNYIMFYVNRYNIGFSYPYDNDMGWPGTINVGQYFNLRSYSFMTGMSGYYISDTMVGAAEALPANWCWYGFYLTQVPPPAPSDGGDSMDLQRRQKKKKK
jgi:hypothetical protein